ncbi:MAG: helix-turn-helix transcriptional regulator [Polyangiales bacterium]
MLRLIPRAPRKIDSAALEAALCEHGQAIDRRSIQRDLHKLSVVFPIVCDDTHKPFGWSWMRDGISAMGRDDRVSSVSEGEMSEPLMRILTMLRLIPRAPKSIGTRELGQKLEEAGFPTIPRNIQRDLKALQDELGLECMDKTKPYGWRWPASGPVFEVPTMDPNTALTLKLSAPFLARVLPHESYKRLEGHVARAEKVLEGVPLNKLSAWAKKVRVTSAGLPVKFPSIPHEILDVVTRALLEDRRFKCTYQRRDGEMREFEVNPIALVYRDALAHLVCTLNKHEDGVVTLLPHRIKTAELAAGARRVPAKFDVDAFVRAGGTGFLIDPQPLTLVALVHKRAAPTLLELPIDPDQQVERHDEERLRVRASVPNSLELQRWILGFGDAIEVIEPEPLRDRMRKIAESLVARYSHASGEWGAPATFSEKGFLWAEGG